MGFLVKVPVVSAGRHAVGAGRHDHVHATLLHGRDEGVGVVPLTAGAGKSPINPSAGPLSEACPPVRMKAKGLPSAVSFAARS